MEIKTHQKISPRLVGEPIEVIEGVKASVRLYTSNEMAVDNHNLVHGGFTFGVADYAAMLAINHPNVVLGGGSIKFIAPVKTGDLMIAEARVATIEGRKREVTVDVKVDEKVVFTGILSCFILDRHVLAAIDSR